MIHGKCRIVSSKHTSSNHYGVTRRMRPMVGKVFNFSRYPSDKHTYLIGGFSWHKGDIVELKGEGKIKYPKPVKFNEALLDI